MKQAEDQRREEEMEQMQRGSSAAIEFPEDPLPEPKMFAYESDGEDSVFSEDEDNYLNDVDKLSPADERLLSMFTAGSSGARAPPARNLADIIEARLREREGAITLGGSAVDVGERLGASLPKKVVKAYRIVGRVLKDYRSGKLPKAFKIIPALENWEDIVFITNPSEWSKHAMYQAVKVFASNLNAKMAQRFFNLVLLPCVREDISEHRKLNFHLYQALRKALYKPAAFYKGFLLPLLEEGCSVREALIVASVVKKSRIPMLHSAAAMLRMMELPYSGPVTIMLHTLVDKKYALPLRVVDALVQFFVTFRDVDQEMPLVWHRALLTFAERYRSDLQDFQLELLRQLLHIQQHEYLTEDIRRALFNKRRDGSGPGPSADMSAAPFEGGSAFRRGSFGGCALRFPAALRTGLSSGPPFASRAVLCGSRVARWCRTWSRISSGTRASAQDCSSSA